MTVCNKDIIRGGRMASTKEECACAREREKCKKAGRKNETDNNIDDTKVSG